MELFTARHAARLGSQTHRQPRHPLFGEAQWPVEVAATAAAARGAPPQPALTPRYDAAARLFFVPLHSGAPLELALKSKTPEPVMGVVTARFRLPPVVGEAASPLQPRPHQPHPHQQKQKQQSHLPGCFSLSLALHHSEGGRFRILLSTQFGPSCSGGGPNSLHIQLPLRLESCDPPAGSGPLPPAQWVQLVVDVPSILSGLQLGTAQWSVVSVSAAGNAHLCSLGLSSPQLDSAAVLCGVPPPAFHPGTRHLAIRADGGLVRAQSLQQQRSGPAGLGVGSRAQPQLRRGSATRGISSQGGATLHGGSHPRSRARSGGSDRTSRKRHEEVDAVGVSPPHPSSNQLHNGEGHIGEDRNVADIAIAHADGASTPHRFVGHRRWRGSGDSPYVSAAPLELSPPRVAPLARRRGNGSHARAPPSLSSPASRAPAEFLPNDNSGDLAAPPPRAVGPQPLDPLLFDAGGGVFPFGYSPESAFDGECASDGEGTPVPRSSGRWLSHRMECSPFDASSRSSSWEEAPRVGTHLPNHHVCVQAPPLGAVSAGEPAPAGAGVAPAAPVKLSSVPLADSGSTADGATVHGVAPGASASDTAVGCVLGTGSVAASTATGASATPTAVAGMSDAAVAGMSDVAVMDSLSSTTPLVDPKACAASLPLAFAGDGGADASPPPPEAPAATATDVDNGTAPPTVAGLPTAPIINPLYAAAAPPPSPTRSSVGGGILPVLPHLPTTPVMGGRWSERQWQEEAPVNAVAVPHPTAVAAAASGRDSSNYYPDPVTSSPWRRSVVQRTDALGSQLLYAAQLLLGGGGPTGAGMAQDSPRRASVQQSMITMGDHLSGGAMAPHRHPYAELGLSLTWSGPGTGGAVLAVARLAAARARLAATSRSLAHAAAGSRSPAYSARSQVSQ